ncbi:MAG: hypothetical protein HYW63_02815 [Candidatus Levybacteria bacterium]|nr:hypothetical protein [Candidatus Levybacteria bacterium]
MQTFIISSRNLEKGTGEAQSLIDQHKIDKFDIEILEFEKALGIDEVRNIQKRIFLKPFRGEKKAVIVIIRESATTEAQNSMLKLLEEPPPSTLIFLITDNYQSFLPTILSRCKLIDLGTEFLFSIGSDTGEHSDFLKNLRMLKIGERLKLAQDISSDKRGAIKWLEQTILAARKEMIRNLEDKQEALKLRKLIHKMELTHYDLKTTNVNTRLALENLFLNL